MLLCLDSLLCCIAFLPSGYGAGTLQNESLQEKRQKRESPFQVVQLALGKRSSSFYDLSKKNYSFYDSLCGNNRSKRQEDRRKRFFLLLRPFNLLQFKVVPKHHPLGQCFFRPNQRKLGLQTDILGYLVRGYHSVLYLLKSGLCFLFKFCFFQCKT